MNQTLDGVFHYYQTAINLRSYRQEVLASNIANGDTPGYKSRDFEFGQALTGAMQAPGSAAGAAALALTATGHQPGSSALDPVGHALTQSAARLKYRLPSQDSVDGNTVDMDVERSNFANNAIHYDANLTQLTGQIKDLIAAMQA
jgi:flagellar basal-body rod protein FlgB